MTSIYDIVFAAVESNLPADVDDDKFCMMVADAANRAFSKADKRPAAVTSFEHKGYKATRVIGASLGCRGNAKTKYGWVVIKNIGKEVVGQLVPSAGHGVPLSSARRYVESLVRLDESTKRKG